jgi:hypothetical protein
VASDPGQPVVVATAMNEVEAAAMAAALDDQGLAAQVVGGLTSGFRAESPGEVRILVHAADAERARQILRDLRAPGPPED